MGRNVRGYDILVVKKVSEGGSHFVASKILPVILPAPGE
jgi:hypothetical protein